MPSLHIVDDSQEPKDAQPLCNICQRQFSSYICPRCNLKYCSLACYKDLQHAQCTESFYKDNVTAEIQSRSLDETSRRRMMDMLRRFERENDEAAEDEEDDDDEDHFIKRFAGIDIENVDANDLWDKLSPEERHEFEQLISKMEQHQAVTDWVELPEYHPWWKRTRKMVQTSDERTDDIPPLPTPLPDFTKMCRSTTRPNVHLLWNLLNIVMTYCYLMRRSMGEPLEDVDDTVEVIESLSVLFSTATDNVYSNVADILVDVVEHILNSEKQSDQQLSTPDSSQRSELQLLLLDDILALLERGDFVRAAADMWRILQQLTHRMKKKKIMLAARKAQFYLAFAAYASRHVADTELSSFENVKIAVAAERERVLLDKETFAKHEQAARKAMERVHDTVKPKISEL
ncbi:hypothetical protein EC973_004126 [Apophysomyces ossiformis]|uniref:HIT-type domain-containing protein n=1 Tax=Apophysomyces ossiformis TaxID=679940 RepID=A0A8H7EMN7_9FUNG|nr:hypothetical protein EC973_004126 [Apophysomyces ossiformis]